ncbi:MAG: NUDIX domain-containing protein, partial [Bacteroidota bacterium]
PDQYNQAIIDFGATHCRPKKPLCADCLLNSHCVAIRENLVQLLPIKSKKIKKKTRHFNYLLFNHSAQVLLHKRMEKDIWQHLYDFPLIETVQSIDRTTLLATAEWKALTMAMEGWTITRVSKPYQQLLTHQKIIAVFWEISVEKEWDYDQNKYQKVERKTIHDYAFPKIIDCYLQDNLLYLELF